jgi:hypothetical protein
LRIGDSATRLIPSGREIVIDRTDFRRGSPRPALSGSLLTVNFILLAALFAANTNPLATRNVSGFLVAAMALVLVHIVALLINVQSIYALTLGAWSERHYGAFARNFWSASAHFYNLVGSFGIAFALWWVLRPRTR